LAHVPPDTNWGDEVSLTATPLLVGTKIFAGYARTTYSTDPAIFCFDLNEERVEWTARSYEEPEITFGNIRTTPALIGNRLLVASAYTNGVDILDAQSGRFLQRIALGQEVFQQWSSPVQIDEGRAALGRVDGVCSILDVAAGSLAASISLTTAESERFSAGSGDGKAGESFPLYPGDPAPDGGICGTPLIDREMLFVGTTDGVVIGVNLNPRPPYQ
jgi:outer membrane protein assembly factor BamB